MNGSLVILTILIVGSILILGVILFRRYRKKSKPKYVAVNSPQVEYKPEKKYKKIEDFDVKKETAQLFANTFYSIMNEPGWKMSYWYDSIHFEKEDKNQPITRWCTHTKSHKNEFLKLIVNVNYEFEYKTNIMSMKGAELECYNTKYKHEGDFDVEFIDYIYNCYYKHKTEENQKKQDAFDNSCKTINSILGKTVERGSKLNELLK